MSDDAWSRFKRLLENEPLPAALVDLDAVEANLRAILSALGDSKATVRIATKSLRIPDVMRLLLDKGAPRISGLMTYSARETEVLAEHGFDDLLLAYPVARKDDAARLAALAARGRRVIATVDGPEHVELLEAAAADAKTTLPVCIDIDLSWRPMGSWLHLGVRRSPVRDVDAAREVGRAVKDAAHLRLEALLAYEAQVAGMQDTTPGSRHLDPVRRLIKSRSVPLAAQRRKELADALRADGHDIRVVNGGGTGSVSSTSADPAITEVTAGSGFLCSHLFDHYRGLELQPAAFFAIPVVRRSDPDHVTCFGGGYPASGAAGPDRLPVVHLPRGLEPVALEGWGEVQTPFRTVGAPPIALGDPIIARHAKAGELAERFDEVLLVRGESVVGKARTLRGFGGAFG